MVRRSIPLTERKLSQPIEQRSVSSRGQWNTTMLPRSVGLVHPTGATATSINAKITRAEAGQTS